MSMTSQSVQRSNAWPYHASPPNDYATNNTSNVRSVLLQDDPASGNLNGLSQRSQYSYHPLDQQNSGHQKDHPQTYQQSAILQQHPQTSQQQSQQPPQQHHQQHPQLQPQQPRQQSLPPPQSQQQQKYGKIPLQAQDPIDLSENGTSKSRPINHRKNSTEPVRRRTSRACDQCNHLRTKCDGKRPCSHCIETRLSCDYARLRKKRGKASKKELAEQAAAEGTSQDMPTPLIKSSMSISGHDASQAPGPHRRTQDIGYHASIDHGSRPILGRTKSLNENGGMSIITETQSDSSPSMGGSDSGGATTSAHPQMPANGLIGGIDQPYSAVDMEGFANHNYGHPRHRLDSTHSSNGRINVMDLAQVYDVNVPGLHDQMGMETFNFPMDSPSALLMDGGAVPRSPGTASVDGASNGSFNASNSSLKYPVLRPVLPHIKSIIPQSLAYELLEHYFASSSSVHPHPASPYLLGFVFSKRSFLRSSRPRDCSPALLASMLWIAARTSNARALTSPPSVRGRTCQKLLNLCVSLLKPLIHGSIAGKAVSDYPGGLVINGSAMGGDGVAVDHLNPEKLAAGTVDDVATYMHLAIVVAASEDKSASLRWWTAAWNLAKELKLGRELPLNAPSPDPAMVHEEMLHDTEDHMDLDPTAMTYTEEDREERRRLWWVLYIADRHLALCYNRPLSLLERECEGLLRPMEERAWQTGNFANIDVTGSPGPLRRASRFEFTGPSVFGFFLPLMTILGEIVDLHQARQHPMLRYLPGETQIWDGQIQHVITQQLEAYEHSMQSYHAQHMPQTGGFSDSDPSVRNATMTESQIHTKIAIAYSTHIMHVLHILATGKWDPISLLDDNDLWISSPSFVTAIGHAVSGAEAVTDILSYDPELSFMPFLYGMYLLQGSFLLLLIADKLQTDASPNVVRACETIVRAHEACVVTLNTEYQRAFRKVMQSALAQVRGRVPEDAGEQQRRRRETLALYRWTGDGSGLAI